MSLWRKRNIMGDQNVTEEEVMAANKLKAAQIHGNLLERVAAAEARSNFALGVYNILLVAGGAALSIIAFGLVGGVGLVLLALYSRGDP